MDRGAWQATVHGVTRTGHYLATKPPPFSKIWTEEEHRIPEGQSWQAASEMTRFWLSHHRWGCWTPEMCREGPGIPQVHINTRKACLTQTRGMFLTGPRAESLPIKTGIRESLVMSQPVSEVSVSGTEVCTERPGELVRKHIRIGRVWVGSRSLLLTSPPGITDHAGLKMTGNRKVLRANSHFPRITLFLWQIQVLYRHWYYCHLTEEETKREFSELPHVTQLGRAGARITQRTKL